MMKRIGPINAPKQVRTNRIRWKTAPDDLELPSLGWSYISSGVVKKTPGVTSTVYAEGFLEEGATYHLDASVASTAGSVAFQLGDGGALLNVTGNTVVSHNLVWNQHPDRNEKFSITATDDSNATISGIKLTKV